MSKNLAAAPATAIIDDKEWRMSPLRDVDISELDLWVKRKILQTAELSDDLATRKVGVEIAAVAIYARGSASESPASDTRAGYGMGQG